jgi:hypothetical protein
MPRTHLAWLLAAFALSVALRAPLLDRPLSAHHEFCTALVLIALHNWHTDGFATHHGAPAITFTGPADRIPPGYTDAPALHDGVLYYLSHPPLAFDLPHALFTVTGTLPNALGLQLFNLLFHLTTAIGLYFIVRELQREGNAPLFAALLYLFMPAPLWFHSNVYMSDLFVQNAWVWHLLVVLRMYVRPRPGWVQPLLAGATLFLTTLVSWPGVWAGAVLVFVALWRWWRQRDAREWRIVGSALAGVALALVFTVWRWTRVVDLADLWAYWTGRFADRGTVPGMEAGGLLAQLVENYRTSWLPVLLLLGGLLVHRWRPIARLPSAWVLFMVLAGVPVLLDHALLLQYAAHDLTALKAGPMLCVLAGAGVASLPGRWRVFAVAITGLAGALYFLRLNPWPGHDGGRYDQEMRMGLAIGDEARPDEVVFTLGFTPEPQVLWYAKRTLFRVDSEEQALRFLDERGAGAGVVFTLADGELRHGRIAREPQRMR